MSETTNPTPEQVLTPEQQLMKELLGVMQEVHQELRLSREAREQGVNTQAAPTQAVEAEQTPVQEEVPVQTEAMTAKERFEASKEAAKAAKAEMKAEKKEKRIGFVKRNLGKIAVAGAVTAAFLGGMVADKEAPSNESVAAAEQPAEEAPASTANVEAAPADTETEASPEVENFVIALPEREGNKLNSAGVPESIQKDPEAFRLFIAEQAKSDPLTLCNFIEQSPLNECKGKPEMYVTDGNIADGNTYNAAGMEAYEQWLALWNEAEITAVDQISYTGYNTGVRGTSLTHSTGVSGHNQTGFDIAYTVEHKDGTQEVVGHSVLNRCTQPTTDKPPVRERIPEGPTDDQPEKPEQPEEQPEKPEEEKPEECPEGTVPYEDRCLHEEMDGPPEEVSQPPHTDTAKPTPGYEEDRAEDVANEQDKETPGGLDETEHGTETTVEDSPNIGGGENGVVDEPAETAPKNPEYEEDTASPGTNEGVKEEVHDEPVPVEEEAGAGEEVVDPEETNTVDIGLPS